jgi:hypothetical protein
MRKLPAVAQSHSRFNQARPEARLQGTRFDTNHGMPVGADTKPEIFIGILKQNVVIVISYTAYV